MKFVLEIFIITLRKSKNKNQRSDWKKKTIQEKFLFSKEKTQILSLAIFY